LGDDRIAVASFFSLARGEQLLGGERCGFKESSLSGFSGASITAIHSEFHFFPVSIKDGREELKESSIAK
jgi:hypothetical protein